METIVILIGVGYFIIATLGILATLD